MGHQKGKKGGPCSTGRPQSRRRGYMPEPGVAKSIENCQVGYYQEPAERPKCRSRSRGHREKCKTNKPTFNFTHTSCIMAIKNYVEKMQSPRSKSKKGRPTSHDNAEKLLGSLKNDIHMISKYEEDLANNPSKQPCSDPFFVLSAMMCKINKLEKILLAQPDCKEQLAKRKEMIMMARCIKKTLLDQANCDNQIMQDKQRKIICLVKSLDMFEKDIRSATKGVKKLCCPKTSAASVAIGTCTEKEKSPVRAVEVKKARSRSPSPKTTITLTKELSSKKSLCSKPCQTPRNACTEMAKQTHCDDKNYDITGLKLTYTKSHVQKDSSGGEIEEIQDQLSCCVDEEDCQIKIIKDGAATSSDECNPIIKQRMNNLSKIWMESARQLIDACTKV
ncbi:uncharacterized protein [Halyomorpha halys]|uniref:uncharacterized protein n=1 Tax=Halyomorpha halys TaxID=286706 RepID=UPI0006D514F7|nr:uncharacterized protein LOC106680318 [Halyomorpha halys]